VRSGPFAGRRGGRAEIEAVTIAGRTDQQRQLPEAALEKGSTSLADPAYAEWFGAQHHGWSGPAGSRRALHKRLWPPAAQPRSRWPDLAGGGPDRLPDQQLDIPLYLTELLNGAQISFVDRAQLVGCNTRFHL
jgi:hypothetical protein